MHKGTYNGLRTGASRGLHSGLQTGRNRGMFRNEKATGNKYDIFWCLGNSICAGTGGGLVVAGDQPRQDTAFEYSRVTGKIVRFGTGAYAGYDYNLGSPFAKFCQLYYGDTGRYAVIVNCGIGSSTLSTANDNNDWQVGGNNWAQAVAALKATKAMLPLAKVKGVLIGEILINDIQGLNGTSGLTVAQIKTSLYDFINRVNAVVGPGIPILFNTPGRAGSLVVSAKMSGVRNALRSACIDYSNCYIAASLSFFTVAFYYYDNIHPGPDGNITLGRMFARWFRNSSYTKWSRSIICCLENGDSDIPTVDKKSIEAWMRVFQSQYLIAEFLYLSMGNKFQRGTGTNAALDWSFMSAPGVYGGFTLSGSAPNYTISTNGSNQYFDDGNQQNLSLINATTSDIMLGIKIVTATTAAGTAACAYGAGNVFIRQNAGSNCEFDLYAGGGDTWADTKLQNNTRYTAIRDATNGILYKNGVATAGGGRPVTATAAVRNSVGAYSTGAPRHNGAYSELWCLKASAVTSLSAWEAGLDTLFS